MASRQDKENRSFVQSPSRGEEQYAREVYDANPSGRANRQLQNHEYAGRNYEELNLIVNHRDIALTLNDGTLIYNS